jgi:hypothetical protein
LGLVNSTTGTIEDIIWKEGANIKKDPLQLLLIAVDNYNRPALFTHEDSKSIIPIFLVFISGRVLKVPAYGVNLLPL